MISLHASYVGETADCYEVEIYLARSAAAKGLRIEKSAPSEKTKGAAPTAPAVDHKAWML
jgi:hypothetical protein